MTRIHLKACPQCVNDKAMKADRKAHTYTCRHCGRTWRDERIQPGTIIIFLGVARSTWNNEIDNPVTIRSLV